MKQKSNENSKKSARERYDEVNTQRVSLKLNKKTDSEILEWLDTKDNKQGAIKNAIMDVIKREKEKENENENENGNN